MRVGCVGDGGVGDLDTELLSEVLPDEVGRVGPHVVELALEAENELRLVLEDDRVLVERAGRRESAEASL